MAYNVLDIANKLLCHAATSEVGELLSNMKLQKMLYYQQGFHLAYFDEPLFDEDIEAWMYGPVVPKIYDVFMKYGNKGIEPLDAEEIRLNDDEEILFDEVCHVYGAYSASGLMNLTHKESPWATTPTGKGNVITREKMSSFFKTRLQ